MTTVRLFCVVERKEVHATADHLGRVTCPACGERVKPFTHLPPKEKT